MIKFSLILPVYNVEKYLPKCLESCLAQDIPQDEYEIIVVIDGSPDASLDIARRYRLEHDCIKIMNRQNGGLSAARNSGLKSAVGKYVWFIDADDYIMPNVLKTIYDIMEARSLDVLWIGWNEVDGQGRMLPEFSPRVFYKRTDTLSGRQFMAEVLNSSLFTWSFIYRHAFLNANKLEFTENMFYEDSDFAFRFLPLAGRISLLDKVCYNYLQRDNSIVHGISADKVRDLLRNCVTASTALKDAPADLKRFYKSCFTAMYLSLVKKVVKAGNASYMASVIEYTARYKFGRVGRWGDFKTNLVGFIYNVFGISLCFKIFKVLSTVTLQARRSRRN